MSKVKLARVMVTGPVEEMDSAICALVLDREFHPLSAVDTLGGHLKVPEGADPYRAALDGIAGVMNRVGIKPEYRDFASSDYTSENCEEYLDVITGEASRLITRKNSLLSLANDDEELITELKPFEALDVDIGELLGATHMLVVFGAMPSEQLEEIAAELDEVEDAQFFITANYGESVRCGYAAPGDGSMQMSELLRSHGFTEIDVSRSEGLSGVPAEKMAALKADAAAAREKAEAVDGEIHALVEREREEVLRRYSYLRYLSEGFAVRNYAGTDGRSFCLVGWIPEEDSEGFSSAAKSLGCACSFEKAAAGEEDDAAPVKLKEGFFGRIFAPFVQMYGYPAAGESSPSIFMLITYCLLFGLMFGDVGQGAVVILVGLYLYKKRGMWLGRILAAVGCAAIVFGFVYGSVFGNEHLLPGFKVMEGDGAVTILVLTAVVGILLIIASGIINIVTSFRQKDYRKALFSANGITGVLFLAGLTAVAGCDILLDTSFLSSAAVWIVFGVLLLSIWLGELLVTLMHLAPKGHKQSVGMMLLEGFFELFEAFLSWLSNCLSFMRVGTYAICHAIMMLIVYTLSATDSGGYNLIGLVIGNIIVMFIEAALVCIQCLRLEFYELFGRFYSGSGRPFTPVKIDYSAPMGRAA